MKLILGVVFLMIVTFSHSQITKKVFFIGNSYTSANNLPSLISSIAASDGNTLTYDAHIPGGSQFKQHAINPLVLNKITTDDWDYVVLQEQSQAPSFPDGQVQTDVYPYAEILADSIYSNNECSIPLFYATWGRETGDQQWAGINTFEKMNQRLFNAYSHMTAQSKGMMSPVGIAFAHVKQDLGAAVSFSDLYTNDGSHPTIQGTYLAACIFNNIIFNRTSSGNAFLPTGVSTNQAEYLQGVADHVVYDVDSVHIDFRAIALTKNTFATTISGSEVSFTSNITEGDFESWDFGDGQTSTIENPIHTYTSVGTYDVSLNSSSACHTEATRKQVVISTLDLSTEEMITFNVYPNPSSDGILHFEFPLNEEYAVYSILGKEIYVGQSTELLLNKGVYIVRMNNQSRKITVL